MFTDPRVYLSALTEQLLFAGHYASDQGVQITVSQLEEAHRVGYGEDEGKEEDSEDTTAAYTPLQRSAQG